MKRLTLMRHAKSDWVDRSLSDIDRPLNERGCAAAPLAGAFLCENAPPPDMILCSSATRTRQTLDLLLPYMKPAPEFDITERLYLASPSGMLGMITAADDTYQHILMIGHNPGTHVLALDVMDPERSNHGSIAAMAGKFPTAALAHFEFDMAAWKDIKRRAGALKFFKTPKMLNQAPST